MIKNLTIVSLIVAAALPLGLPAAATDTPLLLRNCFVPFREDFSDSNFIPSLCSEIGIPAREDHSNDMDTLRGRPVSFEHVKRSTRLRMGQTVWSVSRSGYQALGDVSAVILSWHPCLGFLLTYDTTGGKGNCETSIALPKGTIPLTLPIDAAMSKERIVALAHVVKTTRERDGSKSKEFAENIVVSDMTETSLLDAIKIRWWLRQFEIGHANVYLHKTAEILELRRDTDFWAGYLVVTVGTQTYVMKSARMIGAFAIGDEKYLILRQRSIHERKSRYVLYRLGPHGITQLQEILIVPC